MHEPRDPSTNPHGFTQAELFKDEVEVVSYFHCSSEKFSLNLQFSSNFRTRLCDNVRGPFLGIGQPSRTLPLQVYTSHASAPTAKICRVFSSGNVSPDNIWMTLYLPYPIGNKLSIHTTITYSVEGDTTVQPTLYIWIQTKTVEGFTNIRSKVDRHVTCHKF